LWYNLVFNHFSFEGFGFLIFKGMYKKNAVARLPTLVRNFNLRRKFSVGQERPPQSQKPKEEFPGMEGPKVEGEGKETPKDNPKETQKERAKEQLHSVEQAQHQKLGKDYYIGDKMEEARTYSASKKIREAKADLDAHNTPS